MSINPSAVHVFAPQGAGKSTRAAELAQLFGCTAVVDGWDGASEVPDGALVLGQVATLQKVAAQAMRDKFDGVWASDLIGADGQKPKWEIFVGEFNEGVLIFVWIDVTAKASQFDRFFLRVDQHQLPSSSASELGFMFLEFRAETQRGLMYAVCGLGLPDADDCSPTGSPPEPAPLAKAG